MKISRLEKIGNGKYNIVLDNSKKIMVYDDVILKNNLLYNTEVDDEMLSNIIKDNNCSKVYNKILKYISVRMRSEKQINDYLEKNMVFDDLKENIIKRLKDNGLINDVEFTKSYINDRLNFSNDGPNKIKKDLINYGISDCIIEQQIELIDNNVLIEKINNLIQKKLKLNKKYSDVIFKQKMKSELILLGFYNDDIFDCLNNISIENDNLIENNFDIIYRKYKLKYSGDMLKNKIKEKLYNQGFSFSDIDNLLTEKLK